MTSDQKIKYILSMLSTADVDAVNQELESFVSLSMADECAENLAVMANASSEQFAYARANERADRALKIARAANERAMKAVQ